MHFFRPHLLTYLSPIALGCLCAPKRVISSQLPTLLCAYTVGQQNNDVTESDIKLVKINVSYNIFLTKYRDICMLCRISSSFKNAFLRLSLNAYFLEKNMFRRRTRKDAESRNERRKAKIGQLHVSETRHRLT